MMRMEHSGKDDDVNLFIGMLSKPPASSRHFFSSASLIVIPLFDISRVGLLIETVFLTRVVGNVSEVKAGSTFCSCIFPTERDLLKGILMEGTILFHQL